MVEGRHDTGKRRVICSLTWSHITYPRGINWTEFEIRQCLAMGAEFVHAPGEGWLTINGR